MIHRPFLAACVAAIFLTFAGPAFGYDILVNTDFSDGTAHWKDDPNATACLNAQATTSGAMIPLSSNSWSKISQSFETPDSLLALNVSYSFSDDFSFTPNAVLNDSVVRAVTGVSVNPFSVHLKPNQWVALIVDFKARKFYCVGIRSDASDSKSVTATFSRLLEHEEKTLYLMFPPGTGSVTLSHASLDQASTAGSDFNQ